MRSDPTKTELTRYLTSAYHLGKTAGSYPFRPYMAGNTNHTLPIHVLSYLILPRRKQDVVTWHGVKCVCLLNFAKGNFEENLSHITNKTYLYNDLFLNTSSNQRRKGSSG